LSLFGPFLSPIEEKINSQLASSYDELLVKRYIPELKEKKWGNVQKGNYEQKSYSTSLIKF
jgi:hypothetical protein